MVTGCQGPGAVGSTGPVSGTEPARCSPFSWTRPGDEGGARRKIGVGRHSAVVGDTEPGRPHRAVELDDRALGGGTIGTWTESLNVERRGRPRIAPGSRLSSASWGREGRQEVREPGWAGPGE